MPAISISYRYLGLYFQDDMKVTSKLTLNLGIRYELQTARNERYNRLSWFDPNVANPIGLQVDLPNLRGGLEFADVGGSPRRQEDLPLNNFGPRFGFAYRPTQNTVLRGDYGIFFVPVTGIPFRTA
jgi:outer membrane receptor protein involved in Fe transport